MEPDVGWPLLGDGFENSRSRDHDAGERPIALRARWLLHEAAHDAVLIGSDDSALCRVRHLMDAQGREEFPGTMKSQHVGQRNVGENVPIQHKERFFPGYKALVLG